MESIVVFRNLKAYQLAELCYDFTCRFCELYIPLKDRHHDQMVQAARSGFQNIREGSELSATTKKLELNLTNVARGSIGELHKDYKKYLQRKHLPLKEYIVKGFALNDARFMSGRSMNYFSEMGSVLNGTKLNRFERMSCESKTSVSLVFCLLSLRKKQARRLLYVSEKPLIYA